MSLDTVGLLALGIALVYVLGMVGRKLSRSAAIPIDVVIGDERTEVKAYGKVLLSEPSLIRYTTDRALGLPRLLNFSEKGDGTVGTDAKEYRLGGSGEEPASGIVYAFIAGCCLRARQELRVSQMRPLRVNVVITINDPGSRSKLSCEIHPTRFRAIGAELAVAEAAG
jgi:hypothetical protein